VQPAAQPTAITALSRGTLDAIGARAMRASVLALFLLPGCYDAHVRVVPPEPIPCDVAPPTCMARPTPCEALTLVAPICEGDTWVCPDGAELYASPWTEDSCLPLFGELPLHSDGVHEAPVSVPIDGRCAWVFPSAADGTALAATFAEPTCERLALPMPVATHGDGFDYLALQASFVDASGTARVVARGWTFDASAPFGVRGVGVGFGRVEGEVIESAPAWLFGDDLDLGDAAVVDGGFLYAYGCPGDPHFLEEDCIVGRAPLDRIDDSLAWSIFGTGGWGVGEPVRVFGSGPHRGAVVHDPRGGSLHLYAIGLGSTLELTHADRPEGPWSPPTTLAHCTLPPDDEHAYCAGPSIYLELFDPMLPDELVVGYSIGTTAEDGPARRAATPAAYWPRIERLHR
jgi:hypothetical protein